jgi:methionine-rich copper-binding protein CopC
LAGLGLFFNPARVSAHADYARSEPARDAVSSEPPARVDVWFTEDVFKREGRNFVRVFDAQDAQVSEGDGIVDDDDRTHISTTLPADLPDGRYIARWKTTSDEDGDTDEGAFCFYVGVEPTDEQEAECAAFGEETEAPPTQSLTTPTSPPTVVPVTETAAPPPPTAVTEPPSDEDDGGVPIGAIIGGAVGGAVVLGLIVVGAVIWLRRTLA